MSSYECAEELTVPTTDMTDSKKKDQFSKPKNINRNLKTKTGKMKVNF